MASFENVCTSWLARQRRPDKRSIIAAFAFLPALAFLHFYSAFAFPNDPDLGYHLAVGDRIIADGRFPSADVFRVDSEVHEIAYSWLPDVALALAYDAGGVTGLRLWVIASVFVLSMVLICLVGRELSPLRATVALLLGSLCLLSVSTPRPILWAVILFSLLLLVLRNRGSQRSVATLGIVAIWANCHVSVFLAPIVIATFGFGWFVVETNRVTLSKTLALVAASFVAILCNPYHLALFSFIAPFSPLGQYDISTLVYELRGFLNLVDPLPLWATAGVCLFVLWFAETISQAIRFRPKAPERTDEFCASFVSATTLSILFAVLTLTSVRYFPFFVVSALYAMSARPRENHTVNFLASFVGFAVFLVATTSGFQQGAWATTWHDSRATSARYPEQALEVIEPLLRRQPADGERWRLLSYFGTGHFVTWWLRENGLAQNAGVFLDGRTDSLGRKRLLIAYDLYNDLTCLDAADLYQLDFIIVDRSRPLFDTLDRSTEWVALGGDRHVAFANRQSVDGADE